jgi:DNA replication protein DnaC
MRKSGANREMTFNNWQSDFDYQIEMAAKAYEFATGGYRSGQWFFTGGQVGCGKTHICTAVINELMKTNIGCRYMMWRDEAVTLKAIINSDQSEYYNKLQELKTAPVLYIDDLFKTQNGKEPTQADVNLAFSVINYRYQDKLRTTIISCEYLTSELMAIDEAVGSRIFERSKGFRVEIKKDQSKNYRVLMG